MSKYGLDKVLLYFLQTNIGIEYRIVDLQGQLGPALQAQLISQALSRLSKRKLVSQRTYKGKGRYWTAKNIQTQEDMKHGSRQKV